LDYLVYIRLNKQYRNKDMITDEIIEFMIEELGIIDYVGQREVEDFELFEDVGSNFWSFAMIKQAFEER